MRKRGNLSLTHKAEKALKAAVRRVVEDHKRTGQPLLVWQKGKVVKIPASRLLRTT